jgi:hypothetical protein
MKLQLKSFEKALTQLRRSLDYLVSPMAQDDPLLYPQFRAASIQAFEFSYALSVKMIPLESIPGVTVSGRTTRPVRHANVHLLAPNAGRPNRIEVQADGTSSS